MQRLKSLNFSVIAIFLLISTLANVVFAYVPSQGNVTATAGPLLYKTRFDGSSSGATSPYKGGLGLLVNGDISDHGAFEINVFHMNKLFVREQTGNYVAEETELMQINMGYRRWWSSFFSTSVTFYSSYSMGEPTIVHNDFGPTNTIDTSARDTTEYGFDFAAQTELWSEDRWAVILDGRYSLSLTPKPSEKADLFGVLVGIRYLVQGKSAPPKNKY